MAAAVVAVLAASTVLATASPALADTGGVATNLSGSGPIGSETYDFTEGALSGQATFSANGSWSQPAVIAVDWDPDLVRQGRQIDPSVDYERPLAGTLSITYGINASLTLATDIGDLDVSFAESITASGACELRAGGAAYACHLESDEVGIFDPSDFGYGLPYLDASMVADVTVTPEALATLRTASAGGQPLGTSDLALGEEAQIDPLGVGCKVPAGDALNYALGALASTPGLHVDSKLGLAAGFIVPVVPPLPGYRLEVYSDTITVAQSDAELTMAGPGGSVGFGEIKPNNVPPTLGAVTVPAENIEGTPVQFATSATGPCATGATYSWDFGDGSGAGHTATPQHTYADDGVYTGQVVVTDPTGLTDIKDFTVVVANAAPKVTVIPGAPVTVAWGKPLTLKAQAVDPGAADQSTLTYAWNFDDGDSIDNGGPSATHQWASVGDRHPTVTVSDKDGGETTRSFTVHVRAHETVLAYTGPNAGTHKVPTTLTASLVDEFGTPINGAPVQFSIDGTPVGTASTNASGNASLGYAVPVLAGAHTVSVAYAGSVLFAADGSGDEPFSVGADASVLTYTGGLKGAPNKDTAVSAKLTDSLGRPLAGKVITFTIGSQSVAATTNASGVAATTIKLTQKPAYYPLTVSWPGVAGAYLDDSVALQFSLNKK
ncbi:PKD domain-containing protein [Microbacterium sp. CFBP9034]|uniref:PKD domain-containing protein n=1 Tax=Microbacterium sp. CFBP9034 TaxID=3096540 RepID=UPI002A6B7656|nr:PKD domain-containing protein [Microbacterium sp. CFBP9034]MDY0910694.1 PKD domain-containing protein [Microbacterium sp. CFBP9034]